MLSNEKVYAPLRGTKAGKLVSYTDVSNAKGGYLKLNYILTENDRPLSYNIFPSQMEYFQSCMFNQLEITEDFENAKAFMDYLVEKTINITFSRNEYGFNVAFHEAQPIVDVDVNSIEA